MSTALLDAIRRKRGILAVPSTPQDFPEPEKTVQVDVPPGYDGPPSMQMPEMDLTQPEPPPDFTVGEPRRVEPPSRSAQLAEAIRRTQRAPTDAPDAPTGGQPFTVNREVGKLITGAAMPPAPIQPSGPQPPQALDDGLAAAQEADRQSRFTAGMELAGRQLVGGLTRTEVPQGIGAAPSQVPAAQAAAQARRQALVEALNRKRQGELDASTMAVQKSEIDKNARPPVDRADPLEREKLDETIRHNKAEEAKPRGQGPVAPPTAQATADADVRAHAIANGQIAPPPPRAPDYRDVMARVLKIDPNYDETKFHTYQHVRSEQSTNNSINASKAVRHHMDELKSAVNEMDAGLIDSPGINRLSQLGSNLTGSARYTRLQTAAKVVAAELAQALGEKDVGGREMVQHLTDPNQTKAQWAASLHELERLRDEKLGVSAETLKAVAPRPVGKPSPGQGYVRGKVGGKPGWYNSKTQDFEAD